MNNEQAIKKRIGSEYIIGCFTQRNDGSFCFNDLRGGEGNLVNISAWGDDPEADYTGTPLEVGVFYRFDWHLADDNKIIIDGNIQKIDNTTFISNIFKARLLLTGSNLELSINFQKTIFNEVTGAQHTYIYELLQNANDYPYKNEHVNVKFILTDHYLFFMHSGEYFNLRNIVGISSINQGEKKKNTKTIGYKGIGFKTVFVNNEYVYLKSGDWSLRFDKQFSEEQFLGECPWSLMPIHTNINELDTEIKTTIERYPMRVQFALRHKSDARKNIEQLDKVFSDNQILLFIPNVYKVDVIIDGKTKHRVEKDDTKWIVTDYEFAVPQDLKEWVKENINSEKKVPEKFKDIDNVRISFAIERDGKTLIPVENARIYNYLPTELKLGFNFLLNADFIPNGSRSGLHDVNWNDRIMEQCGSQFADWWGSFLINENEYDLNSVFNILPTFDSRDQYAQLFIKGFSKRIVEIPCIPTIRDGEYHLVKLEDTLYDKMGFIADENPVLTDEEFYEFSDTTGSLPHPNIRCNKNLQRLLKHFNCSIPFENDDLLQLCYENDFQEWLTEENHDYLFLGYLLNSGYITNYWEYSIFLTEDRTIEKASKLYYDIDNFINDIAFLSNNLPRLNVSLREQLSSNYNTWDSNKSRFKSFKDYEFIKKIFDNFSDYKDLFSIKENSINFIHFLSVTENTESTPSDYPFVIEDETIVTSIHDLYQKNAIGYELSLHSWIDHNWIKFLSKSYYAKDEDKVRHYLSSKCNIKELASSDCYKLFIAKESRVPFIADKIKDKATNIDFYHYLLSIQDVINNLTPLMRQSYSILVTDGVTELWAPITKTIFWQDDEWENMSKTVWMPKECCLAITDYYFKGLNQEAQVQLKNLLSTKQIVQKFSVSGMYQALKTRLDDVFAIITTKEISKDLLNFLFKHQTEIFKNGQIDVSFKKTPILCKDSENLAPIESFSGRLYLPNQDALELYNQPWFNHSLLTLCDDYYIDLFDGTERCTFFEALGLKRFEKLHYLRAHMLLHLEGIEENIKDRDNNISFHRYIGNVHDELSDKDLANVKRMPIFISSPDTKGGILAENSNNHYLPSKLLSDIISKDLVPISILDSIHPDYIISDKDKSYFIDKLGNTEIDEEGFYQYIISEGNKPDVISYLKDKDRNIKFWRWVCDSNESKENKAKLNILPMLYRVDGNAEECYEEPKHLFISDLYSGVDGLELFICDYVNSPKFVSSSYWEEGIERNWSNLLKTLKVTVDYKDIVFKNLLPNLAKHKDIKVVNILGKYADTFKQKLSDEDEIIIHYLNDLYLKCNDGIFRTPTEVIVSGKYFDIDVDSFPDIEINNLVSEEYITNIEDEEQRRNIIKFIVSIADYYKVKAENATQLQKQKIHYFSKNQDYYAQSEAHYRIIGELADAYNNDAFGISEIINNIDPIKLYTTTGKFIKSFGQYLSSVYVPECDYMANGITEIDFVSEAYNNYCTNGLKHFLTRIGILDSFNESNLRLLRNKKFALYFWRDYAKKNERTLKEIITEEKLRDLVCIPTSIGMKKPKDVYNYRNSILQKIVLILKDGQTKLPVIELPNWVQTIGLREKLYVLDCLEYLSLDIPDHRRLVISWLVTTPNEILERYTEAIDKYKESANWFNGAKKWVPLSTLVALEWGNDTLKGNFGGNAYVCNPSYMPEYKDDFEKLCRILDIKILTNKDFTKQKYGKCQKDIEAIREISNRLLYLAYKSGKSHWQEIYAGYKDKLDKADISTCERIIYSYDGHIFTDLQIYSEEATALWYVDSWKGPMFLDILDWIKKKLEVKGTFDENFLRTLFLRPFTEFIEQQEGGSLPAALLDYLSEHDKVGIEVDEYANEDDFTENVYDTNSLPEDIKLLADVGIDERKNIIDKEDEVNYNESYNQSFEEKQSVSERKLRNDFGGTHQRHGSASNHVNLYAKHLPSNTYSADEYNRQEARKSYTERLQDKWEKQRNSNILKPHSAKPISNDLNIFDKPSSVTRNNEPFFEENFNTDRYTWESDNYSNESTTPSSHYRDNFSKRQKEAQEELDKATDQADLNEAIYTTPKYTFLWFKYIMEQLYNQKKDTATTRSVQIDFKEITILSKDTISIFKPNRVIPKWLEHTDDISLHILAGNTSKKIEIELQYITDDAIWAYSKDVSELDDIINNADKIRLLANGNYANHIDSLTKQFIRLDLEDDYNLRDNLPDCIRYIYGPPGTGKTTRIVNKIQDFIETCDTEKDILVLTPTNKAADVIASRLADKEECSKYTYRFGITEDIDYLDKNRIYTREDNFITSIGHHIVVTTAARYAYDYFMPNEEMICDHHWDYIIIDEASMIDIVTITFILFKSHNCKFIISGDPKQIQPVRQNDIQPENIYQMVGLNSFAAAQNNPMVECLDIQYRSIPTIGDLVSKFSYNGLVTANRSQNSQRPLDLGFDISSINFVGFKTELLDNLYGMDAIDGSAFHLYSAIFGYEFAAFIANKINESTPEKPYSIGIVSPYKKQADSIKQMIELKDIANKSCQIHSGTVHNFQGDECDIMIIILNPPINVGINSHVNDPNIINVAISRAKDYVFLLVPDNKIQGFPTREVLGTLSGDEKKILFCSNVEKAMYGQDDYIQEHTNISCHMPVNVYYEPSSLYEVRKDDMAVDIQINEQFR